MNTIPQVPATPEILIGYCGPIEWAMLDAPGDPVWRRAVWGPIGPSSEPERMGVVNAGDMRGNVAMRLPLAHPLAMCHAARWLAGRLGMDPGSTAPRWIRGILGWTLSNYEESRVFPRIDVGLSDAEALRLACLAVGGGS